MEIQSWDSSRLWQRASAYVPTLQRPHGAGGRRRMTALLALQFRAILFEWDWGPRRTITNGGRVHATYSLLHLMCLPQRSEMNCPSHRKRSPDFNTAYIRSVIPVSIGYSVIGELIFLCEDKIMYCGPFFRMSIFIPSEIKQCLVSVQHTK